MFLTEIKNVGKPDVDIDVKYSEQDRTAYMWTFGGSSFLPILRVPSVPPINFQNLPPVKKIKYNKILTYILRSIFLEIPHLELPHWRKTPRDMNGKGECHI
jgi:hypothetical protein